MYIQPTSQANIDKKSFSIAYFRIFQVGAGAGLDGRECWAILLGVGLA
jgi:hypothetical protein